MALELEAGRAVRARARGTVRASYLAATLVCLVALLLPALWNGYPLLQFDTGGYLARWYEGYLVPSRSTVVPSGVLMVSRSSSCGLMKLCTNTSPWAPTIRSVNA